jgi:hypothetical protein
MIGKARVISLRNIGVNFDVAFLQIRHLTTMLECHVTAHISHVLPFPLYLKHLVMVHIYYLVFM